MDDRLRNALIVAAIVFGLMVLIPVASFLLRALLVAALAGLVIYLLQALFGTPR